MRRLTLEGVPPGEAARVALAEPLVAAVADDAPLPDRHGRLGPRRGGPGGRVLAMPGADGTVRGLGRAAMALDAHAVTAIVREEVARHGVLHTWDHVLRPVLVAVGARWAATGEGVEVEHLLSDCTAVVLREIASAAPELPGRRPVLLSCAPDEHHSLPLHALAAGLAERGVGVRTLGPALPGVGAAGGGPPDGSGRAVRLVAAARHGRPVGARGAAGDPPADGRRRRRPRLGARPAAAPRHRRGRPQPRPRAGRPGPRGVAPTPTCYRPGPACRCTGCESSATGAAHGTGGGAMTSALAGVPGQRRPEGRAATDLPSAVLSLAEAEADAAADALHDGALQALVVARYAADAAVRGGDAAAARDAVQEALVALRRAVWLLRPRGSKGLLEALQQLATQVVDAGCAPVVLDVDDDAAAVLDTELTPAAATVAYRLVQRAAGDVPRHRPRPTHLQRPALRARRAAARSRRRGAARPRRGRGPARDPRRRLAPPPAVPLDHPPPRRPT